MTDDDLRAIAEHFKAEAERRQEFLIMFWTLLIVGLLITAGDLLLLRYYPP